MRQVLATDGGGKTATARVVLQIQDQNDNDPVFWPKVYDAIVGEDATPGTPVLTVTAADRDENPRLQYSLVGGNVRGRFSVSSQNGQGLISVAQPLDYKQEKRFVLTVQASDSGGRSDTATVYLNVSDANTHAPAFEAAPYSATVFEDAPIGTSSYTFRVVVVFFFPPSFVSLLTISNDLKLLRGKKVKEKKVSTSCWIFFFFSFSLLQMGGEEYVNRFTTMKNNTYGFFWGLLGVGDRR